MRENEASRINPDGLEVIFPIKVEGHGRRGEMCVGSPCGYKMAELGMRKLAAVGGAEQPSTGREACHGFGHKCAVVFFYAPDTPFFIARKGGRVEHDGVERASLAGKSVEPVQGIAFTEEVR